mgnify:FL=1|tara:strand:+ start:973 stop:1278 length:306 start_codon:yes stop_codon:yes gene_type:complete
MTGQHSSPSLSELKSQLARRVGVEVSDIDSIIDAVDQQRGTLGPEDMAQGLATVVQTYVDALTSAAERVSDPVERLVVDRFLDTALENLAGQLEGASHQRN